MAKYFSARLPPVLRFRGSREAGPEQGLVCLGQRDAVAGGAVQAASSEEVLPHHESADDPAAAGSARHREVVGLGPRASPLQGPLRQVPAETKKGADSQSCPHLK